MLGKVFNFVRSPFQLNESDPVKKSKLAFTVEKVAQKFHLTPIITTLAVKRGIWSFTSSLKAHNHVIIT